MPGVKKVLLLVPRWKRRYVDPAEIVEGYTAALEAAHTLTWLAELIADPMTPPDVRDGVRGA